MDKYLDILKKYWGYDAFRGIQREIIDSIAARHDTLGLMPTGGGKSITFQVPAIAAKGKVCIVVTPLIALMKDQVESLKKRRIAAAAIYTGMKKREVEDIVDKCIFGRMRLLYVSPERLTSPSFLDKCRRMPVSFICVDEAHCIVQWGYDFRPAYLTIPTLRRYHPDAPILALTATATPAMQAALTDNLAGERANNFHVFSMSFERKNINYIVRQSPDKDEEMKHIISSVNSTTIVYTATRAHAEDVSKGLNAKGISAVYYHAGMSTTERNARQTAWINGEVQVMVATNAFGMGIDKADVRLVIHRDMPDSIEAYFQEAGRAGRDGQTAYAVLLASAHDGTTLRRRIGDAFPPLDYVRKVYDDISYFLQVAEGSKGPGRMTFDIALFCQHFHHFPTRVEGALDVLGSAKHMAYDPQHENAARVMFIISRSELYKLKALSSDEDSVIEALLRLYGSLFIELTPISISLLAETARMSEEVVNDTLHNLYAKRIITYIPSAIKPTIAYLHERCESALLTFPPVAWAERLAAAEQRAKAMIEYSQPTISDGCRVTYLLKYFGQKASPCGTCDLCREKRVSNLSTIEEAITNLVTTYRDGAPITALRSLPFPTPQLDAALRHLLEGETITLTANKLYKS